MITKLLTYLPAISSAEFVEFVVSFDGISAPF